MRLRRPGDDRAPAGWPRRCGPCRSCSTSPSGCASAAPDAWIIDFTNPVGIVTRALLQAGHRAVGLCNVAIGFQRRFAGVLGVPPESLELDHVGLNHLTWERAARVDGVDRLPELLEAHAEEIAASVGLPTGAAGSLGVVPSYYLRYFYAHDEVVREQLVAPSRAAEVAEIERRLLELYADPTLDEKPELLGQRGGAFYSEAAVQLAAALLGDGPASTHVVNLRNDGTLPFLPDDAVIEVPASVDARRRARGRRWTPLEPLYAGLVAHVTAYEDLALEAALHGGRQRVFEALLAHPLVGQVDLADGPHRPADRPQPGAPAVGLIGLRVLAIDAGNSKTDVCVVSADGELLGSARGGPFRPAPRGAAAAAVADRAGGGGGAVARAGSVDGPARGRLPGQRRPPGRARGPRGRDRRRRLGALLRGRQRHLRAAARRPRRLARCRGGLWRRDQLHRRAAGRNDGAVRRRRAHLRRLGRRRPSVAGGDVVGGAGARTAAALPPRSAPRSRDTSGWRRWPS